MKKNKGSAQWKGNLKQGTGTISTGSGALEAQPYGFNTRFEDKVGTNPEELVAAAHASCFSMALANILGKAELVPDEINTTATVALEKVDGGFEVTSVHLDVRAKVPGATPTDFAKAANDAKENCPISKLLNAKISMEAKLVSG